jgi:hypothetical protein
MAQAAEHNLRTEARALNSEREVSAFSFHFMDAENSATERSQKIKGKDNRPTPVELKGIQLYTREENDQAAFFRQVRIGS